MRYIGIGGEITPKYCLYGPRPAEGLVFNSHEWWSITDHLIKDQREKDFAAVLKAKEEKKKEISFNMTRNWSNTLASIKTQGNQKRLEKMEKLKQDRIDTYNEIIKNRIEEKAKILADVKKVIFQDKDAIKTINSAVLYSLVLEERRKQVELKNFIKSEQVKKEEERVLRCKKDLEDYEREKYQEKLKEREKINIQKQYLDKQIAEMRRRKGSDTEFAEQKQDLINMKIEGEKIHHCNMVEKSYRKNFAARYMRKTENHLELERNLALEEEEEDEINKIYKEYNRKFVKERKEREERIKNEEVERRTKIAEMLAQKLAEAGLKEEESFLSAVQEKENKAKQEEENKKENQRLALTNLLEGKRKAEERRARELYEKKEEKKWEMMQLYRSAEINKEWEESERKRKKQMQEQVKEGIDLQCKEAAEKRKQKLEEWLKPLEDEAAEKEELLKYCQETVDFAKEHHLPEYPILEAISEMKKKYGIVDKTKILEQERKQKEEAEKNECTRQKSRRLGNGCYCLKY